MKGATLAGVLLLAAAPAGFRLLERDHPKVEEGLSAYERDDEASLHAFDAARAELPRNATVELNRGNALYRLGRLDEARDAYRHAIELDEGPAAGQLQARDEYNLGTTLAKMGQREPAIQALRRALRKDPSDDQARHNLEVLLRQLPPPQPSPPDGGSDAGPDAGPRDGGQPDGGSVRDGGEDGGQDGGEGDAGSDGGQDGGADGGQGGKQGGDGGQDAGPSDGGGGEGEEDGGQDGGEGQESPPQPQKPTPADSDCQDAERMLDAVRQNEKNLQLWRFQQKQPRKPRDKDW